MSAAISVRDLHRHFGDLVAVGGISFDVEPGRVVGFVGANGAGKTTTMRIMVTLDQPSAGSVEICGYDAVSHPQELRRRVGWMPDAYGRYPNVTVLEYLDFMARAFGYTGAERKSRLEEVMDFTDLTPLADREMSALSKGMAQRLCLGRALLNDPEVMVLDEPAAGLDPKARAEFKRLVRLLAEDGKTIFISSHILSELAEMCDALLFIDGGRLVYDGDPEGLGKTEDRAVAVRIDLLPGSEATPEGLARWLELAPDLEVVEVTKRGARIRVPDEPAAQVLLTRLVREGFPIVGFSHEEVRLEDAFIEMLGRQRGAS